MYRFLLRIMESGIDLYVLGCCGKRFLEEAWFILSFIEYMGFGFVERKDLIILGWFN